MNDAADETEPSDETYGTASGRLMALVRHVEGRKAITLGEVLDGMGRAGMGLTILLLALPALIPLPGPFGMFFGACLALVALQVLAGARRIWLPNWLRARALPAHAVRAMAEKAVPWLLRVERHLEPRRLKVLTGVVARAALGLPILVLAITIALPIPFGNVLPVLALAVFALALLERDGLAVLVGLILSAVAVGWAVFLVVAGAKMTRFLWDLIGWGA